MTDTNDTLPTPQEAPSAPPLAGKEPRGKKPRKQKKRKQKDSGYLRIEELEKLMELTGGQIDPETVVSMYMPHRKRKLMAALILITFLAFL